MPGVRTPRRPRHSRPVSGGATAPVRPACSWDRQREFADQSLRLSHWARAYYDQERGRGAGHHAALRALAYKWMRILFRCWQERRPYDEADYIAALRRRGSPLAAKLT